MQTNSDIVEIKNKQKLQETSLIPFGLHQVFDNKSGAENPSDI